MKRERAVLSRRQLIEHRKWLRLGFGTAFDLRSKRYEAQVCVGWTFERGHLSNCEFVRCNLAHANFDEALLADCVFQAGSLEMAAFHKSKLTHCAFNDVGMIGIFVDDALMTDCTFTGGNLATVTYRRTTVRNSRYDGTAMRKSRLESVTFEGCHFKGVDFTDTDWTGVDTGGCTFEDCTGAPG